jgi:hypothetical protein
MLERFSAEIDPNLGHALIGQAEKVSAFLLRN